MTGLPAFAKNRNRRAVALVGALGLGSAALGLAAVSTMTEAQRATEEHVTGEFALTPHEFSIEGSVDGTTFDDSHLTLLVDGSDDPNLRLEVGRDNAVYQKYWVRLAAGTELNAQAGIIEGGLPDSEFANSLSTEIWANSTRCSGTPDGDRIQNGPARDSRTAPFDLEAGETGQPGEAVQLCVVTWMTDDSFVTPSRTSEPVQATWTVNAQSTSR
ncbi:hypothetical protein ACFWGD_06555 [Corynebacterium sp. NPDC060344]|uniref:hypothetical protein n=1 Tax=Corynebacterium sp. NPDC060344 TaxID=3347101 RepID=UPI0036598362